MNLHTYKDGVNLIPVSSVDRSAKLFPQVWNVIIPETAYNGVMEDFRLPNSKEFISQYSRISDSGRTIYGLGTSSNQKLSQIKAYAEYVERKAFLTHGVHLGFSSTNGIATHLFDSLAAKAAKEELFERDAFLMHWYSETPLKPLKLSHVKGIQADLLKTEILGYAVRFFETYLGYQKTTVCFLISKGTSGFCVGLSCGRGRHEDIKKSFLEASINLFLCDNQTIQKELTSADSIGLLHHRNFWLYSQAAPKWLFDSPVSISEFKRDPAFEQFHLPSEHFRTVGVKSTQLLGLAAGSATAHDLELVEKRLQKKLKIHVGKNLIHPIP